MFIASSCIQFGGNEAFSPQKLTVARGPKGRLGGICTLTDLCLGLGPIGTLSNLCYSSSCTCSISVTFYFFRSVLQKVQSCHLYFFKKHVGV